MAVAWGKLLSVTTWPALKNRTSPLGNIPDDAHSFFNTARFCIAVMWRCVVFTCHWCANASHSSPDSGCRGEGGDGGDGGDGGGNEGSGVIHIPFATDAAHSLA